mmetsp:Transcript_20460/g.44506  ORF Transcript_20460/g.44506 Transcript_20460/m.44506 type:complete len:117 (-) Transcript_20460:12-362(-)
MMILNLSCRRSVIQIDSDTLSLSFSYTHTLRPIATQQLSMAVQSFVPPKQTTKKESENEPNIMPRIIRDSLKPPEIPSSTAKPKWGKVSTKGSKRKFSSMAAKPKQRRKSTSGKKT